MRALLGKIHARLGVAVAGAALLAAAGGAAAAVVTAPAADSGVYVPATTTTPATSTAAPTTATADPVATTAPAAVTSAPTVDTVTAPEPAPVPELSPDGSVPAVPAGTVVDAESIGTTGPDGRYTPAPPRLNPGDPPIGNQVYDGGEVQPMPGEPGYVPPAG